jgi:hypothetical protein
MVIKPNANIGIGITNPATRLELKNPTPPSIGARNVLLRLSNTWDAINGALNEPTIIFDNGTVQTNTYSNFGWSMGAQVAGSSYFRIGRYEGTPSIHTELFKINNNGSVFIGTNLNYANSSNYKLVVQGKVLCEEVRVRLQSQGWPDYVFDKNYKLKPLQEVEKFIKENHHLPEMPSAKELDEKQGVEVSKMLTKQQQKIEELTLYLIELKKEIDHLKNNHK